MDRRATLATLFGKSQTLHPPIAKTAGFSAPALVSGLSPYTGPFEFEQAAHLLRRCMFGPTYQQIRDAADAGLDVTVQQLFTDQPMPDPPLNPVYPDDPLVPIGETWVGQPYTDGIMLDIRQYRNQSLNAWTIKTWKEAGISLREKMTLFWHNHFVISDIQDPAFVYKYITLLRENAFGNFRELAKAITVDPAMLRYLNGRDNSAVAPNENYARELLELFTIGKGPQVGPGDYTNYTEDDVVQMARVLTGWRDYGYNTINPDLLPSSAFVPNRHDTGDKQLSFRFDNLVISDLGDQEYAHLIDVIFAKEECARFIGRKLYRWFVHYIIDEQVEQDVIEPMAQILLDNDYEVAPVLDALFRSEHFFDQLSIGPMIKHPVDFVMAALNQFEVEVPASTLAIEYAVYFQIIRQPLPLMQMVPYNPPSVAGWKAWYQEPVFYRNWISSPTLGERSKFTSTMAQDGYGVGNQRAKFDLLKFAASLDDPFDPNSLIDEFSKILYPQPITQEQKDLLKGILLPGLPDFEWTLEYGDYVNDPTNPDLEAPVVAKLTSLITAMLSMPEYYLS